MKKSKLQEDLEQNLMEMIFDHERDDQSTVIHASDIYSMCLRRHQLFKAHQLSTPNGKQNIGLAVTYGIGRKVQDLIVEALHTYDLDTEVHLKKKVGDFTVSGSVDVLLKSKGKSLSKIVEVKSINHTDFKELTEPMLSHLYQVRTYMWLAQWYKGIDSKEAYIIYVDKAFDMSPIKIFTIKPDKVFDKEVAKLVKGLKAFSKDRKIQPRSCTTKVHYMARKCLISNFCFNGGV